MHEFMVWSGSEPFNICADFAANKKGGATALTAAGNEPGDIAFVDRRDLSVIHTRVAINPAPVTNEVAAARVAVVAHFRLWSIGGPGVDDDNIAPAAPVVAIAIVVAVGPVVVMSPMTIVFHVSHAAAWRAGDDESFAAAEQEREGKNGH